MTEKKPTLDYAHPLPPKKRRRPWWIDMPLVLLTAVAVLFALWVLAWVGVGLFQAFSGL